ncbi:hypothetical protein CC117_04600 [Parafrankia colletiae]|uniref:Uncharacterized protein n=1 Tax=Parafrankia colletiae TaxID=573497 RepID=A0A1S1QTY7_9ACTN|nr:hypothetical protein [Parafrankia colletiae]MCK9900363.1 hypothetical protein [Frankia sp. Cpl3]OHV35874.1 hypothetical protein CC117_04600 [Parafrankia colletiae]
MNAFRRGWVGLALFFSALLLMPLLVVEYQNGTHDTAGLAAAEYPGIAPGVPAVGTSPAARPGSGSRPGSDAGAGPSPLATVSTPTSTPSSPGVLVGFAGVTEGETISGFRRITLQTSGSVGRIIFVLTGPTGRHYNVPSAGPPYVFAPHDSGWQTTEVVDGVYFLEAVVDGSGRTPVATVRFRVTNHPAPTAGR